MPPTSKEEMLDCDSVVAKFCDRSPCPGMLEALGRWIMGDPESGGFVAITGRAEYRGERQIDPINYCPFCGTALTELSLVATEVIELPNPH